MKVAMIYIVLISSVLIFYQSCAPIIEKTKNNNSKPSETQLWWNGLNETWQIVFLRQIDKLGKTPSESDLLEIINLERVDCDHFPLGETNLEPLRKLKKIKVCFGRIVVYSKY